jgi:hypothetical protein
MPDVVIDKSEFDVAIHKKLDEKQLIDPYWMRYSFMIEKTTTKCPL